MSEPSDPKRQPVATPRRVSQASGVTVASTEPRINWTPSGSRYQLTIEVGGMQGVFVSATVSPETAEAALHEHARLMGKKIVDA